MNTRRERRCAGSDYVEGLVQRQWNEGIDIAHLRLRREDRPHRAAIVAAVRKALEAKIMEAFTELECEAITHGEVVARA